MVLEMSMESLFAVVDIFWVSKLGSDAVALVGVTETVLSLVYAVAMGLSAGATAIVSRRIGEKDPDGAARSGFQVILLAIALAATIGVLGVVLAPSLLVAMGAASALSAHGATFTRVMLGGNVIIMLLFVINAIFRGAGDAAIAMRSLWLANILNIVLGPCFIFGVGPVPALGVTGAAVATTVGRGVGVIYQLVVLASARGVIRIDRRHARLEPAVMAAVGKISASAGFQTLVETASWLGLVRILASFGSAALAGYTIAIRVLVFALLPAWGMANAAATLVGQNLGARAPDRAERSVKLAAAYNVAFLGVASAVFVAFPEGIIRSFTDDPAVVPFAVECLRIVALGFFFFAFGGVVVQAFNGAGDTTTPLLVNIVCFWLVKIPAAYVLARGFGLGPRGVFIAIAGAYSVQSAVAAVLFRRGKWKTKVV
ncbi:MAG: MATE family efflux transporter [Labilithrix sp.]|nr:MATE family efflux transporter [Labilithrix sp.]